MIPARVIHSDKVSEGGFAFWPLRQKLNMRPPRHYFNAPISYSLNPEGSASTIRRRSTRPRRGGRVVECTGLENQQGFVALRGFKSHPLRQTKKGPLFGGLFLFCRVRFEICTERNAIARQTREARGTEGTVQPCSTNAAAQLPVSGEPAKRASPSHPLRQTRKGPLLGAFFCFAE